VLPVAGKGTYWSYALVPILGPLVGGGLGGLLDSRDLLSELRQIASTCSVLPKRGM
jgi:hypothetical protein